MPQPKLTIHNQTGHALDVKGAVVENAGEAHIALCVTDGKRRPSADALSSACAALGNCASALTADAENLLKRRAQGVELSNVDENSAEVWLARAARLLEVAEWLGTI